MTIIKSETIAKGFRVTIKSIQGASFSIESEQHFSTYSPESVPEHGEDGWRVCSMEFAETIEDAEKRFSNMVEDEMRYH